MRNGIFLILVFLTVSCKRNYDAPCRDSHVNYYDLGAEALKLWPFQSYDTLYFSDQNGDTVTFLGTTINHWYDYVVVPNNPECVSDSNAYENKFVAITDTANFFTFYSDIQLTEDKITISGRNHNQYWEFNLATLMQTDSATFDSLSFNGSSYKHIFAAANGGDSLYYSPISGIVRYKSATQTLNKWLVKK